MKMKKGITIGFVFLLVLANSIMLSAVTGSMGNARMILYPEVNGWTNTIIEKSILVKNVNDMPINITLELDENSSNFIELIDKSFILESGEEKKAQFEVKVKKEGKYEGRINVFFRPIEGKESGVVLSSTIVVIATKDNGYEDDEEELEEEITEDEEKPNNSESINKSSKTMTYLTISTFILVLALIILFYIAGKKRTRNKVKKRRTNK